MNNNILNQNIEKGDENFGFRDLITLLFKHKGKIIGTFFLVSLAVAIGTFLMTPTYETYSSLLVKIGREHIYRPEVGAGNPSIDVDRESTLNSEIKIAQSQDLIRQVLEVLTVERAYPEIAADPPETGSTLDAAIAEVEENLTIQPALESDVIEIVFRHSNPKIAAQFVNQLVDFLMEKHLKMFSNPKASFLEKQVGLYLNELNASKAQLKDFKQRHGLSSPAEERSLLLGQRNDLDTMLKSVQNETQGLQGKLASLLRQKDSIPERIPLSIVSGQHQIITQANSNLLDRRRMEQELLAKYKEGSPLISQVRKEIEVIESYLKEQEGKLQDTVTTGKNPLYQQIEMQVLSVTSELKAFQAKEETIKAHLQDLETRLAHLDNLEQEMRTLEQRVAADSQNYEMYVKKFEEARLSEEMDRLKMSNISVIQPATVPVKPIKPRKTLNLLVGMILGTVGGLSFGFVSEFLQRGYTRPEQAAHDLGIPILATISQKPKLIEPSPNDNGSSQRPQGGLVPTLSVEREMLELLQVLTTVGSNGNLKIIQFIGSRKGEGTSTLVREFGRTIAELANKSVLVIDIDSSQPAQHSHFGLDPLRSIERIIKEGGALDVPTERFGPPGLYLGCFSPHPQAMTQMNDYWDSHDIGRLLKNRFDLILIDSAPVSQNGEGLVLCRKVDGVVLVVEADKSRSPIVRHVRDKILQSGGNLLGIVFNKQQYYIPEWLYSKL